MVVPLPDPRTRFPELEEGVAGAELALAGSWGVRSGLVASLSLVPAAGGSGAVLLAVSLELLVPSPPPPWSLRVGASGEPGAVSGELPAPVARALSAAGRRARPGDRFAAGEGWVRWAGEPGAGSAAADAQVLLGERLDLLVDLAAACESGS